MQVCFLLSDQFFWRKFNEQLLFTRNVLFAPLYLNNFCQQLQKIKTTMAFVDNIVAIVIYP